MTLETTLFGLDGLESLSATYWLYSLKGMPKDKASYHTAVSKLVRRLSFHHRAPFISLMRDGAALIACPASVENLTLNHRIPPGMVTLVDANERLDLTFNGPTDELDPIRLRFLDFAVGDHLFRRYELWQPGAGQPYFAKRPSAQFGDIELFEGYSVRATRLEAGSLGLAVEAKSRFLSSKPIGPKISKQSANALAQRHCVHKMGDRWYEFRIDDVSDRTVGEPSIMEDDGSVISLVQYLNREAGKAAPPELVNLNPDGAALSYFRGEGDQRSAPAELCYLVEDTQSGSVGRHQRRTILRPGNRRERIHGFVRKHLQRVKVNNVILKADQRAQDTDLRRFPVPDLLFGQGHVLTGSCEAKGRFDLRDYSRARRDLMLDRRAGFVDPRALARQAVIVPASVKNSWGPAFIDELKAVMAKLLPNGNYEPEIHTFDDFEHRRDLAGQVKAIQALAASNAIKASKALVMLHPIKGSARNQDKLAALVVNELRDRHDIQATIIHTRTPGDAYIRRGSGERASYVKKHGKPGNISGYLKSVALNKICLANGCWPFVLAPSSPLHSDLIVGVDVKGNMAVFTLIAQGGRIIRYETSRSKQREKLNPIQVRDALKRLISAEAAQVSDPIQSITIHRDGRVWPEEIEGFKTACQALSEDGIIEDDYNLSAFSILKSSPAPLRLFDFGKPDRWHPEGVFNPPLGAWLSLSSSDGYVCNTGAPLLRQGTANPLHVRRGFGDMPMAHALEDVFVLSCLTWMMPDSSMRLPISIQLCDLVLFEDALQPNRDEVTFAKEAADA